MTSSHGGTVTGGAKGGWKAQVRRAPNLVRGLATAVLFSLGLLGMEVLKGRNLEAVDFVSVGAGAVFVGAFMALFGRWRDGKDRELPPGPATARNLNRAIATGKLPEQAIPGEWVRGLQKIIRQDRRLIWLGLLELGLFTALGIFLILDRPDYPWFGVLCTALFAGITIWLPFSIRRRRMRIEALIAQLSEDQTVTGDAP
jgi:hypothetical protein